MLQCTQHALHIFLKQQIQTLQKKFQTCTLFTVGEWVSGKPSSSYSDLTKVCVTINGSPNMLHSNGIESTDMLEAASGFFVKEKKNSTKHRNLQKFYTEETFGLISDSQFNLGIQLDSVQY